ncbi:MAG TPA: SdpI family protein [Gemmatimonadales bacterium]|nr:SdpI family protein [Gemmatimonadales bacterium]
MLRLSPRTEWPLWGILGVMFVIVAVNWHAVPDQMPVHWGLSGQPDRWGGRAEGLLLLPCVAVGLYLILLLAPRIDPGRANYVSFATSYAAIRFVLLLVLLGVQVATILAARGVPIDISRIVPLLVGALMAFLGSVFSRLRPNWFIGIRTPWTLSSKRSWDETHHLGGWVFIILGLLLMSTALVRATWYLIAALAAIGAGILLLVVYSYVVWSRDPDKTAPAGTMVTRE